MCSWTDSTEGATAAAGYSLQQRDKYLDCLAGISAQLLAAQDPFLILPGIVNWLQEVSGADRCFYFRCFRDSAGRWRGYQRFESVRPGVRSLIENPRFMDFDFSEMGLERWARELSDGNEIRARAGELPDGEGRLLSSLGIAWIMLHPIISRGELVGFIGFELCDGELSLSEKDAYLLRAAANSISAAMQRVSSEGQLREAHTFLSNILRSSTEYAIVATDLDFRILHYNPVAEMIFGYREQQVTGHTISETHIFDDDDESFYFHIASAVASRGSWEMEIDVRDPEGSYRTVHVVVTGMRDEFDELCGYIFISRDVTEQRGNERKMLESQRMESVGLLAGGIAHDFNNILMGILGYASLAKDKVGDGHPAYRMLHTIEQSADRAAVLTNQLLAYARGGKYQSVPLRIDSQLDELLDILATNLPKGIEIEKLYMPNLPIVLADPAQVQQVLMNICLNAGEAIAQEMDIPGNEEMYGRIVFTTGEMQITEELRGSTPEFADAEPGRFVFLSVEDNGCGMDEETLARIFDPFYTTKFTGRGLGLSAVQGIIGNHGGCIQVDSAQHKGTKFVIYLPASAQQFEEAGEEEMVALGGEETILVIDDEEVVRQVSLLTLTNLGYKVMLASSGRDGLEVFREHGNEISLVILDLTMPGINGETVLSEMNQINAGIPVLLTSGYDEARARGVRSYRRSAGFLQKPYNHEVLARAIRSILDSSKS